MRLPSPATIRISKTHRLLPCRTQGALLASAFAQFDENHRQPDASEPTLLHRGQARTVASSRPNGTPTWSLSSGDSARAPLSGQGDRRLLSRGSPEPGTTVGAAGWSRHLNGGGCRTRRGGTAQRQGGERILEDSRGAFRGARIARGAPRTCETIGELLQARTSRTEGRHTQRGVPEGPKGRSRFYHGEYAG